MEEIKGNLITVRTLAEDFRRLGLREGLTVLLHSSFKSLGEWVAGGPAAVILALEEALGEDGTLIMPTHSTDLTDPSGWINPPVPKEWWDSIREEMPPYDPGLTLPRGMGIIPETFRKQTGVRRSGHPLYSFAAWGKHADTVTAGHELPYGLGDGSPLRRLYDLDGMVLMLGVGHLNNTSMHLAEYRSAYREKKEIEACALITENGARRWARFPDLEWNSDDFGRIGEDFERETGEVRQSLVAAAPARLMSQRAVVDYAVRWLERSR
ncbi:AAC(3) family N-acetyltransferase [Paenibacillus sp. 7124]|uniref:Aminoglycoside N(3)-acetyltransferase n=1 Tax=Paenibacillus apii TaxID=1850370 RepID=A0A6M1PRS2_9BACL|nr:AAC(3) family N-acetyltransferase [Paenibacillus apii]NGM84453.1 AAC(3) family N-acetyltransferase [Paenibacillus apii]NJJ38422.1 AAC(3) family N-acetyltransferase [Paenibacillus apii]